VKKAKSTTKNVWETTDTACLLRHKHSRKYYGRFTLRGKQKWVNLDTNVLTVAKLRLPDEVKKMEQRRALEPNVKGGHATMGELMETFLARGRDNADLKPSSLISRDTAIKKIKKTWPGIEDLEPKQITPEKIHAWAARFKREGTKFTPPKSNTVRKGNSATSVNRAIDALRRVLDISVKLGQIHGNPVNVEPPEGKLKKKIVRKKLELPSSEEAEKLIVAMYEAGQHGGWGVEASLLCRFLMMTGARIGEVPLTLWRHVHWNEKELHLPGYKTDSSPRDLPLFAELETHLRTIIEWRKSTSRNRTDGKTFLEPSDPIFRIKECQKTIDAACMVTKVKRITHHDWRHLFATICIESDVDIPTISRWLGHNDGGILAMKTYGHLRKDHSQHSAKKVNFGRKK
jgi:integrase